MLPCREVVLSLHDVERAICAFERKYGISSAEFIKNEAFRRSISEDDVFQWEAFLDHRSELRNISDRLRRDYLNGLQSADPETRRMTAEEQVLLAA